MLLSVCIITKNEESSIENCILSVIGIADEIVILDSYSTDLTVEIAKKYTNKIFFSYWKDDFSYARNLCKEKASGKWILFLDADEEFVFDKNFISTIKKDRKSQCFGLIRKEIYRLNTNNKLVSYPVAILRLFRNKKHILFQNIVHERIDNHFFNQEITLLKNSYIRHNIHKQKKEFINQKQKYYLSLINKQLTIDNDNIWLIFQKAKTHFYLNNFDIALTDLKMILQLKENKEEKILIGSYVLHSLICLAINEKKKAIEYLNKALKIKKTTVANLFLGDIFFKNKDYKKAIIHYLKLETNTNFFYKDNMFLISHIENSEKIYKIASCLISLNLNIITIFYIFLQKKKDISASTYYLLSIAFHKIKKKSLSKKFLDKSKTLDPLWVNEFNY